MCVCVCVCVYESYIPLQNKEKFDCYDVTRHIGFFSKKDHPKAIQIYPWFYNG